MLQGAVVPEVVLTSFYGCEYEVRLAPIREGIVKLASERGLGGSAQALGVSRMTLYRLMRPLAPDANQLPRVAAATLFTILNYLGLRFADISQPAGLKVA